MMANKVIMSAHVGSPGNKEFINLALPHAPAVPVPLGQSSGHGPCARGLTTSQVPAVKSSGAFPSTVEKVHNGIIRALVQTESA
jgi:hypothetical protein